MRTHGEAMYVASTILTRIRMTTLRYQLLELKAVHFPQRLAPPSFTKLVIAWSRSRLARPQFSAWRCVSG